MKDFTLVAPRPSRPGKGAKHSLTCFTYKENIDNKTQQNTKSRNPIVHHKTETQKLRMITTAASLAIHFLISSWHAQLFKLFRDIVDQIMIPVLFPALKTKNTLRAWAGVFY